MRQQHWAELLNDYDCEIRYHLGKVNVVADALSHRTHVRSVCRFQVSRNLHTCIREVQYSSAKEGTLFIEIRGATEDRLVTKSDGLQYYLDRIWVPDRDNFRELIMNEAHKSKYSIQPGADKIYHNLRTSYGGMV
ncbi:uncharacterized protein LOC110901132 [Helianthus annuus]|uniref:uncharacterized protein LOC110901132 n=1 Tax=Helianthus annuus TaxID=4232 RepID=UPI000B908BD1|nr:uncharacterized protein LOC110901132 [Helianthus annuus]